MFRRFRSSQSGRYVTKDAAAQHPDTTVSETARPSGVHCYEFGKVSVHIDATLTPDQTLALASELTNAANTART